MNEHRLPDPNGKPKPASLPVRMAKAGAHAAGTVVLAGGGVVVLAACLVPRTLGATRSMQLVWEDRQRQMEEVAQAAASEEDVSSRPFPPASGADAK